MKKRILVFCVGVGMIFYSLQGRAQSSAGQKSKVVPKVSGQKQSSTTSSTTDAGTQTAKPSAQQPKPVAQAVVATSAQKSSSAAGVPAENQVQFGVSIEAALPLGDLNEVATFGGGIHGLVKYKLTDKFSLRGSLGYTRFFMKTITSSVDDGTGNLVNYSIKPNAIAGIPLRLGGSYDITEDLFVQAAIGLSFINNGVGTAFLYTPGLGYRFGNIEAMAKYEVWSKNGDLSFASLHLAYHF